MGETGSGVMGKNGIWCGGENRIWCDGGGGGEWDLVWWGK